MNTQDIIKQISMDIASKKIRVEAKDGYRYYTDGVKQVVMTSADETAQAYYNTFIAPSVVKTTSTFDDLPRCTIYVGQPDTGKTYQAQQLANDYKVPHILIMARDNLNLETLLEDFTLVDGKPVFKESLAIKMLSGTEPGLIIIDEFNTLLTGVMKTLQPLLDNTSKTFEYKGKVYNKNLNCKFILTLNDKDKGISIIPDAILSRSKIVYFDQPEIKTLAQWSKQSEQYVQTAYDVYKALGLLSLFGTRQINVLSTMKTVDDVTAHIIGLCSLRGMNTDTIKTIEVQRLLSQLCLKP